jgi:hypothetical protein
MSYVMFACTDLMYLIDDVLVVVPWGNFIAGVLIPNRPTFAPSQSWSLRRS